MTYTMKQIANLNRDQCLKIAEVIGNLKPNPTFYEREYLTIKLKDEVKLRMNFFAVAICHQTYKLHHPLLDLWGWDFIEHVFIKMAQQNSSLLNPEKVSLLSTQQIAKELRRWFSYNENSNDCTLDRIEERSQLIKDASESLIAICGGQLTGLITDSKAYLIRDGKGLYEVLQKIEAYSDPQRKKSTFLIKLLIDSGLLEIGDPENFIPIMDYHMQRVLMRMGCLEISDPALYQILIARHPVTTDEPIRSLCIEAAKLIAIHSGHPLIRLNDFLWSLGRSCCNNTTLCKDHLCEKSPCTFNQIISLKSHQKCEFETACKGFEEDKYRKLWQPVINTHYY